MEGYHLDIRFVFRRIDVLDVAGADCAGGYFGLEVAVGSGDGGEEGIEAGEDLWVMSVMFCWRGGGL